MKIEKVLIDTVCDCCLRKESNVVRIDFDIDDIIILCPSCVYRLVKYIKSQQKSV